MQVQQTEKTTTRIIRSELDHNPHIEEYAINYEQYRQTYGIMLICLITILIVIAGM